MRLVFLDESGYTFDWRQGIDQQPWYVLSAVLVPAGSLANAYSTLRRQIAQLGVPGQPGQIGRGFEIKARDIATGSGWWREHNDERNSVRNAMLSFPDDHGGTAFVVAVDKQAHLDHYAFPDNPYMLSLRFMLERLEMHLGLVSDDAICIYDRNTRLEEGIRENTARLLREGSQIEYYSPEISEYLAATIDIERVLEVHFGSSPHSVGLQVADYFATMAYTYLRDGRPSPCGWWDILQASLARKDGVLDGIGLKLFP